MAGETPTGNTVGAQAPTAQQTAQENQQLRTRIAELEASQASGPRLKVDKPTPFKGERKKLQPFLAQMQLYYAANPHLLAGEADKVLAASTFLEGDAMDWFEPYMRASGQFFAEWNLRLSQEDLLHKYSITIF